MNKLALIIISFLFAGSIFAQQSDLEKNIRTVINGKKATVGVAVIFDGKDTVVINNQYRYPTMSVYKFHLALAVLDYLDKNKLSSDTEILVKKTDLLPDTHSPLRDEHPEGNFKISIGELLKYSVSQSDNNACDMLFKYIGGTKNVDKYIKKLGIKETAITATEAVMHENFENQYLNWTTPYSTVCLLEMFLKKDILSDNNKKLLEDWMIETTTGKDKIKALLPENTIVGHKTGSSFRNDFGIKIAENDMGFVRLPNGKQYTIAIFVMNSPEEDKTINSMIAEISKTVYDYYKMK